MAKEIPTYQFYFFVQIIVIWSVVLRLHSHHLAILEQLIIVPVCHATGYRMRDYHTILNGKQYNYNEFSQIAYKRKH